MEKTQEEVFALKSKIQAEALEQIEVQNHWASLLAMATGSGKTKVPIDYIKKHASTVQKISLLVPTTKLRDENWKAEFDKWGASEYYDRVERYCYASGSKVKGKHFNLLICDEAHNLTELSAEFFKDNTIDKIILLTATLPKKFDKIAIFNELGVKTVYTLTLDEAVALGIVAPYRIKVVLVPVDNKTKYIKGGTKKKPFLTTERANIDYLDRAVQIADPYYEGRMTLPSELEKKAYQMAIMRRLRGIYSYKSKIEAVEFILRAYVPESDRTLIFAGTIEGANKLCKHRYHSKTTEKDLQAFMSGEINRLSSVNKLNEGLNVEGVDSGVVQQAQSSDKDLIQRLGRLIRYREGHEANLWITVLEGTQDEVWLASALQGIDPSRVEVYTLKELQDEYVTKFKEENGIKF